MGCISSKPAAKEAAGGDGKANAAAVSQQVVHAADEIVRLAAGQPGANTGSVAVAAAAPHTAGVGVDEGEACAALASPPAQGHGEQHEAEAGGPELNGAVTPPVDLDAALRELNGRVQSRCGLS